MWYTFWLAYPNRMTVIDIHPEVDLSRQKKSSEEHNHNILISGKQNKPLTASYWRKIQELMECTQQNFNNSVIRKRNIHTIYVASEKMDSYTNMILTCFVSHNLTASGDRIFLNSVLNQDFDLKFAAALEKRDERQRCLDILMDVAIVCYIAALTNTLPNIDIYNGLKNTATSITETAATNTATLGIESAAQVIGNAMAGAAISAIVDVAVSSATIYVAKRQKDDGRMTEEEFNIKIKKTVCESSLKFVGGTTGSILGQALIPVPVVGAFVGGFCGSLIGAGIGKGINYGVFDRKNKKTQNEKKLNESEQHIKKRYGRKIRGYVPKIIIYNESKKEFEEKHFQKTVKNYFKPVETLSETQAKVSEAVTVKPYLNKWRNKTLKIDEQNTEVKATTEKQRSVLSKWKKSVTVKTPEKIDSPRKDHQSEKEISVLSIWKKAAPKAIIDKPDTRSSPDKEQQATDKQLSVLTKWRKSTPSEVAKTPEVKSSSKVEQNVNATQDSPTIEKPLLLTTRRESYIDRLSPNQLITQVKSSLSKSSSKEEDLEQISAEASQVSSPLSTTGTNSPRSNTPNDVPIFHRLSIKSLKDSFRNISNSSLRDENEFEREILHEESNEEVFSETAESQARQNEYSKNESEEETKFSRFKSFHSSIRMKNRERMKFPSLQKVSLFNSSVDAEGNVYDNRKADTKEYSDDQISPNDDNNNSPSQVENNDLSELKDINQENVQGNKAESTLNGLTNKLLALTGLRSPFKTTSPDQENADNARSSSPSKKCNGLVNSSTDDSFEEHSADKKTLSRAPLSNSLSENSSTSESPELKFSEREFDWWNRKLRHRFENEVNKDEGSSQSEQKKSGKKTVEKHPRETKRRTSSITEIEDEDNDNSKKEKKIFSTLKSFTKKFK
ncbi:transcriptional regulator ATRX-like [Clytia hemisphaerica]|uniref:Uncharacterized protein n=1 Tax=Clytia hemisphaerica TaxID=252671 RepID=A0A7M5WSZ3_9CNID